jgi:glutaredoxin
MLPNAAPPPGPAAAVLCCPPLQILNSTGAEYVTVNVLEDELLRSGMKEFSQWPTFPQVYIDGEFFGGADIMIGVWVGLGGEARVFGAAWAGGWVGGRVGVRDLG